MNNKSMDNGILLVDKDLLDNLKSQHLFGNYEVILRASFEYERLVKYGILRKFENARIKYSDGKTRDIDTKIKYTYRGKNESHANIPRDDIKMFLFWRNDEVLFCYDGYIHRFSFPTRPYDFESIDDFEIRENKEHFTKNYVFDYRKKSKVRISRKDAVLKLHALVCNATI